MAIARLSVKAGKAGAAGDHAEYIAREGRHKSRLEKGETLEGTDAGNMPAWAATEPAKFWRAADAHERSNGTTYRELELALPRELTPDARAALVREFVTQELGERHPYQWAIHRPKAADGKDQPHAHIMFSERRQDGIARDPEQFFKRWNAKHPERGGAHKRFGEVDGPNRSQAQRTADLKALRGRWEAMTNNHLERSGVDARIDMRSYRDQGIDRAPEAKQIPSAWRGEGKANVIAFRQARAETERTGAWVQERVPDVGLALQDAERGSRIQARVIEGLQEYERNQAAKEQAAALAKQQAAADQAAASAKAEADKAAALEERQAQRLEQFKANLAAIPRVGKPEAAPLEAQRGELIDHGAAPYRNWPEGVPSYFVSLRTADSKTHNYWSAGLEGAIKDSGARVGDVVDLAQTGKVPAVVRDKDGTERTVERITWAVEIRARGPDPEQVYADRLSRLQEQGQEAAAARIAALQSERQQWTQAQRDHEAAKPWHPMRGKWDAAGVALDEAGRGLAQREGVAARSADPRVIQAAAVAELRREEPGLARAADQAREAREAREQEARRELEARAEEARRLEQEKRRAEYERTRMADEFEKMAKGREYEMFGYRDNSDKWRALPNELKEKIEAFNQLPKEKRPEALERIGKEPRTAELLKEAKEISREQGRGR